MVVAVVVLVGLAALLLVAWLVDRSDRGNGHKVTDAKMLHERIKLARRQGRSNSWRRMTPQSLQRDDKRPGAQERRPVKRGQ